MTRFLLLLTVFQLCVSAETCNKKVKSQTFKGKLEIAGICSNYTISLLEGNMATSLLVQEWKDEVSGREYENVFRLGSPCTFPASIKQGDSFYFILDSTPQNCQVCLAYYPTPSKSVNIKVIQP